MASGMASGRASDTASWSGVEGRGGEGREGRGGEGRGGGGGAMEGFVEGKGGVAEAASQDTPAAPTTPHHNATHHTTHTASSPSRRGIARAHLHSSLQLGHQR